MPGPFIYRDRDVTENRRDLVAYGCATDLCPQSAESMKYAQIKRDLDYRHDVHQIYNSGIDLLGAFGETLENSSMF